MAHYMHKLYNIGLPGGANGKETACQCRRCKRCRFSPGVGLSPGGGHGNPLQYSCLENCYGQRSLAGKSPWGLKESDMIEATYQAHIKIYLQYFGHMMRRANSLEKILMLGKIEGRRRRGKQRMTWLDSITNSTDMNLSRLQEIVKNREIWCAAVHRVAKSWTQFSN